MGLSSVTQNRYEIWDRLHDPVQVGLQSHDSLAL